MIFFALISFLGLFSNPIHSTKVCLEHFSAFPFESENELYLGAVSIPNLNGILLAFSNEGSIVKIDANSGAILGPVATVPLKTSGGEQGLLSIAVRPDFTTSGKFYTWGNTVASSAIDLAIDEWTCSTPATVSNCVRTGVVLEVMEKYSNHNGGTLQFDSKRPTVLYLSTGDGGSACDPENNSRNPKRLTGKMLRIDVGTGSAANFQYTTPGNPTVANSKSEFCGKSLARQRAGKSKKCREVWVMGLRNPFRCAVDKLDPEQLFPLYCGDVGQGRAEEVDKIPTVEGGPILNYGWDIFEGTRGARGSGCTSTAKTCPLNGQIQLGKAKYVCPIAEDLQNDGWRSVIGGVVCRDCGNSELHGKYLYADFFKSESLTSLDVNNLGVKTQWETQLCLAESCVRQPVSSSLADSWLVSSFGLDNSGRVFVVSASSGLYRVVSQAHCGAA